VSKILIGIINCHSREVYANAIRSTWLPLVPKGIDVIFFRGNGAIREPKEDEVFLDCEDDYQSLPSKVKAVIQWALERDYGHVVKCDDDTVLIPEEFLISGFTKHDFVGNAVYSKDSVSVPWGFLYTLSKKSMELVSNAPLPRNNNDEHWISNILAQHGISLYVDNRYFLHEGKREDFIEPNKRSLRIPPRTVNQYTLVPAEGTFAWCIHIPWQGHRTTPDAVNIAEFKKVFKGALSARKVD
jgi:hypothetical protein